MTADLSFAIERHPDGTLRIPAFIDLCASARFPATPDVEPPEAMARAARDAGYGLVLVAPLGEQQAPVGGSVEGMLAFGRHLGDSLLCALPSPVRSAGTSGSDLAEIASLARLPGAPRALRLTRPVKDTLLLRRVFEMARAHDLLVLLPSYDAFLAADAVVGEGAVATRLGLAGVPEVAESIGLARIVELARLTRARVHVTHLFTVAGVAVLERARAEGLPVSGCASIVHLAVDEEALLAHPYDVRFRTWPPLPSAPARQLLLDAVRRGVLCVSSGHGPAPKRERDVEFAVASAGSATLARTPRVLAQLLGDDVAVRALAVEPARILGLRAPPARVQVDLRVPAAGLDGVGGVL